MKINTPYHNLRLYICMYTVKVQPISFNIHMHLRRNFVEGQCFSGKTFYAFALIRGLSVIGMLII